MRENERDARGSTEEMGAGSRRRGERAGAAEANTGGLEALGEIVQREVRALGGALPGGSLPTDAATEGGAALSSGALAGSQAPADYGGDRGEGMPSGSGDPARLGKTLPVAEGLLRDCDLVFRGGILLVYAPSPAAAALAEAERERIALAWQDALGLLEPPEVQVRLDRRTKRAR